MQLTPDKARLLRSLMAKVNLPTVEETMLKRREVNKRTMANSQKSWMDMKMISELDERMRMNKKAEINKMLGINAWMRPSLEDYLSRKMDDQMIKMVPELKKVKSIILLSPNNLQLQGTFLKIQLKLS